MAHLLQVDAARFPIPAWYDQNLCEPTVQLAIRDLVRPGDIVFDVGANAGALSVAMSRLVGLRGAVCSFEASRRIVDKTQHNLIANGCSNVQLFHRAIYHTSGQWLPIYHGSHLNDSILSSTDTGIGKSEVKTLALDDFAAWTNSIPRLIKMDIEGAEYDALRGSARLIAEARPTFILEQNPDDMRCWQLLDNAGYLAVDLGTYCKIERREDFKPGVGIANVLFIHRDKAASTPYQPPFQRERIAEIPGADFRVSPDASRESAFCFPRTGRYLLDFDFSAERKDNEVMMGVESGVITLARYHGFSSLLAGHYQQLPLQVQQIGRLNIFFRFCNGTTDPTLRFRKVTISRIVNFDNVAPPLID